MAIDKTADEAGIGGNGAVTGDAVISGDRAVAPQSAADLAQSLLGDDGLDVVPEAVARSAAPDSDEVLSAETAPPGGAPAVDPETAARRSALAAAVTARLGEVTAMLMGVPRYRYLSLQDLDWLVVAPLMADRLAVASAGVKGPDGKVGAARSPAGAVFTATVSEEVDQRIREQIKAGVFPVRLKPANWASGEIAWVLDVVAPAKPIAQRIVKEVVEARFKDGKVNVHPVVKLMAWRESSTPVYQTET